MKSFSTLLPAFVLALLALSSNHSTCNGQRQIQGGARIHQREEAVGATASTAEENSADLFIPRSYLRQTHPRRLNLFDNRATVLQRRGLLGGLIPSSPQAAGETTPEVLPPTTQSPEPPVTTDPPTPPPVTTDPVPPTTEPVPPTTAATTEVPVSTPTVTTEQPTVAPTTASPPPVTSEPTVPPVKTTTTTVPPVVVPTSTKSRGPASPPATTNGGGHGIPTGSGRDDPSSTMSSAGAGVTRPADASTSGTSSSNKTAITIGVVIGAIVVCAGIGVWVFRKWKLSPSRQFKSKIRNSSNNGSVGGLGSGRSLEDDDVEYANYTDIFRPTAHDSALPVTASSMTTASASAAAVGSGQGANLARGGSGSGPSSTVSGSSPPMQHAQQQVYYDDPYGQQVPTQASQHQPHMSLSSTGTVPDYSQYRYPGTQQPLMMSGGHGYDSGVTGSILGGGGGGPAAFTSLNGSQGHQAHTSYASSDYPVANDHFLRELRE
ncbi:hypothetical protein EMPS_09311 [Entomortierella parvispora]|uniref:Mid2 domain-containing protein n=1 Tax=Entomortierella parvispora TaxID=205924 RepID=A0A9P3HIJ7_9FUNG|nr:hypothetical protein EMPS_09311 [Entomortierella parvispora]